MVEADLQVVDRLQDDRGVLLRGCCGEGLQAGGDSLLRGGFVRFVGAEPLHQADHEHRPEPRGVAGVFNQPLHRPLAHFGPRTCQAELFVAIRPAGKHGDDRQAVLAGKSEHVFGRIGNRMARGQFDAVISQLRNSRHPAVELLEVRDRLVEEEAEFHECLSTLTRSVGEGNADHPGWRRKSPSALDAFSLTLHFDRSIRRLLWQFP